MPPASSVRAAQLAGHNNLVLPRSKLKVEIIKILKAEGFVEGLAKGLALHVGDQHRAAPDVGDELESDHGFSDGGADYVGSKCNADGHSDDVDSYACTDAGPE